jgi:probable HAF family extracellular repeat protein
VRDTDGAFTDVPHLATKGSNASYPNAINAAGDVVGVADNDTTQRAFLWDRISDTRDLGSLDMDGGSSGAIALNDNGQVVGYSSLGNLTRAVVWSDAAGMEDLGHLPTGNASKAYGINNAGQIVGSAGTAAGEHAFLWTKETGMVDLNTLFVPGTPYVLTIARGINDLGQIVGTSNSQRALLLTPTAIPWGDLRGNFHSPSRHRR